MPLSPVTVRREPVLLPTYEPLPPDRNPMFLERRVYQGSSGRVYPLPFYNRISEEKKDRAWDAVYLENEYIRVMILPELGGRIHIGEDKTNGYHFFYRQGVIKPALVGLAGPWVSGGVEFNWPQHHRPATFMPVAVEIEEHADGSRTVWLGDHDPMERMKGMHGVCLHPDRAVIEVKMRAYNRTPHVQTFLWWANVATHVHEGYQSFFPPDVRAVADHARRATSRFPLCEGRYYGVDYAGRARSGIPTEELPSHFVPASARTKAERESAGLPDYPANDLSWYANIPVPTSYMCLGSEQDFSGGYDHFKHAGLVQIANHHIAPGKKQWTWGNHEFGYAWDRNLTDSDGPYIELMLGVFTDNQPDFSFLQPGETKAWSVFWYPIQQIGPAQAANGEAALSLKVAEGAAQIGVAVTRPRPGVRVELRKGSKTLADWTADLAPDRPLLQRAPLPRGSRAADLSLRVLDQDGGELIAFTAAPAKRDPLPAPATEPPQPADVAGADELYRIGRHLWQYRHATRSPVLYWREALRRDPGDSRCNGALGVWHFRRGENVLAEKYLRAAIARLTSRNQNPDDGEPFYQLGLVLRSRQRFDEAYAAFYKATWNQGWQSAAFHALAEIDVSRRAWTEALDHLDRALRVNTDNLRARNLCVIALRALGRGDEASAFLEQTLSLDPLDWWARDLRGEEVGCDTQVRLDLALDYARADLVTDAIRILEAAQPEPGSGTAPLVCYYLAWLYGKKEYGRPEAGPDNGKVRDYLLRGAAASPDYCFPARLEEIEILGYAIEQNPKDARAPYYLGNLLYDRRRYDEAIELWKKSARLDPGFPVVWRNLGIGLFNVRGDPKGARRAYAKALQADPSDARLLYESDQLLKRVGERVELRLRRLEARPELVAQRDDSTVELCALYNQTGQPERAARLLAARRFQPWEGGEGLALEQHTRTQLALGRKALAAQRTDEALAHFTVALAAPANLGEARHLLANSSNIHFWLGEALAALGRRGEARAAWRRSADFRGDFQEMTVRPYSEMTYYSACALVRLGRGAAARKLFGELEDYAKRLARTPANVDYFATSLPTMLLFEDQLQERQERTAMFLRAQALVGLGRRAQAKILLRRVLEQDPGHAGALDLLAEMDVSRS